MPYLKPESLRDTFDVSFRVRDGGNPYEFGICASIRGQSMRVTGLSMGEMVTINREIARAIREAKHARSLWDGAALPVCSGCVAGGVAGGWLVRLLGLALA